MLTKIKTFVLLLAIWQQSCLTSQQQPTTAPPENSTEVSDVSPIGHESSRLQTGAERMQYYLPFLSGKRLGMVVNQTSMVGNAHLVDTLLSRGMDIKAVFAPEHGFRGDADAGEQINNARDTKTGLPIISLYGRHKEPTAADLADIDMIVFDIQDVGARFYTYISTLHYVMQAAVKYDKEVLVLDRPNPNGHYVDGPVLDLDYQSFVGMHPVPVVHGMTIAEYARMINGEGWLENGAEAKLLVNRCANYTHNTPYRLPVKPSPNLPNMRSIYLYPSLCFFEGTVFSVGRGTDTQFQIYGHPDFRAGNYRFRPQPGPGAKYPKLENQNCKGISFTETNPATIRGEARLNLDHILHAFNNFPKPDEFFLENNFIDKLAGSRALREQILAGWTEEEIRASWQEDLQAFKRMRENYLIYD